MHTIKLPCGGTAYFEEDTSCSYRCTNCYAVIGSIAQSKECKDAAQMYANWEALGGEGWCYNTGRPKKQLHNTEYMFNPDDYQM